MRPGSPDPGSVPELDRPVEHFDYLGACRLDVLVENLEVDQLRTRSHSVNSGDSRREHFLPPVRLPVSAHGGLNGLRGRLFPIHIEVILLPVCRPPLLKVMYLVRRGDTESLKRQDHGTNTNVRRCRRANVSAVRAPEHWRADIPLGSNSLKCRIQIVA